jgi:hypothetical protein
MLTGCSAGKLTNGWYHLHDYKGTAGFKNNGKIQLNDSIYNLKSVAIDFGLGWRIPLGMKSGLKLEARYQYGLTDFSSHKNVDARFDPLIFSVGYLYKI